MPRPKKPLGRPVKLAMPEPIDDTPENVANIILNTPPKKQGEWRYIRETKAKYDPKGDTCAMASLLYSQANHSYRYPKPLLGFC